MTTSIIGAGSSGCFCGYNLAKQRNAEIGDVRIYEEHNHFRKICSGIVTQEIEKLIKIKKDLILNKINNVRVYSPDNNFLELTFKKSDYVLDREKFNKFLSEKAIDAGCELYKEYEFMSLRKENNKTILKIKNLKNNQIKNFETTYLIGADGLSSRVAKSAGLYAARNFFYAIKAKVRKKNNNTIKFYPYIKDFAWASPISEELIEVAVASRKNPLPVFNAFLKKFKGKSFDREISLIPTYNPKQKMQLGNCLLIGEAATINKATTGGGIIYGMISGKIAAESIIHNTNYEKECKKIIGKDLWLHFKIRNTLNKFNNSDWNKLIEICRNKEITKIFEVYSRDYPVKFAFKLLFKDLRLLYFSKKLF